MKLVFVVLISVILLFSILMVKVMFLVMLLWCIIKLLIRKLSDILCRCLGSSCLENWFGNCIKWLVVIELVIVIVIKFLFFVFKVV